MPSKKVQNIPEPQHPAKPKPRFEKILLIDDSDVDLFINETILNAISLSKEISREEKPLNVLNRLKNVKRLTEIPELIFLDLKMEGMNGFDFLEEFNKLSDFIRNKCKIVIVTSSVQKEDKYRALMNPNVIRYLIKPLDVFQLKDFMYS